MKHHKMDPRLVSLQPWEINYLKNDKFDFWEAGKGHLSFSEVKAVVAKAIKMVGHSRIRVYEWLRVRYSEK